MDERKGNIVLWLTGKKGYTLKRYLLRLFGKDVRCENFVKESYAMAAI